jgi:hypothetical protein
MHTRPVRRYLLPVARLRMLSPTMALDLAMVVFVAAVTEWQVFSRREHLGTHIAGPRWLTIALPLLIAAWRASCTTSSRTT